MSFAAERWAWEQKCANGVAKSVLALLGFMCGRDSGECYPSIEAIMKATQHTERAVRKAIAQLIESGLISREDRRTREGRITSPTYRLLVTSIETIPENPPPAPAKTPPLNGSAPAKTHPLNGHLATAKTQGLGGPATAFEQELKRPSPCENAVSAPAKTHPEPYLEPKKERKGFSRFGKRQEEPPPTVAQIEAGRRAYAQSISDVPGPIAAALRGLASGITGKAHAPGWGPRRDREEQIELLSRRVVKSSYLLPAQIAALRQGQSHKGASP